jgi:hypothetical protein
MLSVIAFIMEPLYLAGPETSASSINSVQPSFLVGTVSRCCSPSCSLLRAAHLKRCRSFVGVPSLVCFCKQLSKDIIMGTSLGVEPAFLLQLNGWPWNPSLQGYPPPQGVLPATKLQISHQAAVTSLLPFLQERCGECRHTSVHHNELPHCPVIARGTSNRQMQHGHA